MSIPALKNVFLLNNQAYQHIFVLYPRAMAACGGDNVPGAMHPEAFK